MRFVLQIFLETIYPIPHCKRKLPRKERFACPGSEDRRAARHIFTVEARSWNKWRGDTNHENQLFAM